MTVNDIGRLHVIENALRDLSRLDVGRVERQRVGVRHFEQLEFM